MVKRKRVFVVSAVLLLGALAGTAVADKFTSTAPPTEIVGKETSNQFLVVDETLISCEEIDVTETIFVGPKPNLHLTPVFRNCSGLGGFSNIKIAVNGCWFQLLEPNKTLEGKFGIVCPVGKEIVISVSGGTSECELSIPEAGNEELGDVSYVNDPGPPGRIEVAFDISELSVDKDKDVGICALSGVGFGEAAYAGDIILSAKVAGVSISVG